MSSRVFDLIDRAWEAKTDKTRMKLARQALDIDPDAIDANVLLAQATPTAAEALAILRAGVVRGKKLWAAEIKRPSQHPFWLDIGSAFRERSMSL